MFDIRWKLIASMESEPMSGYQLDIRYFDIRYFGIRYVDIRWEEKHV